MSPCYSLEKRHTGHQLDIYKNTNEEGEKREPWGNSGKFLPACSSRSSTKEWSFLLKLKTKDYVYRCNYRGTVFHRKYSIDLKASLTY